MYNEQIVADFMKKADGEMTPGFEVTPATSRIRAALSSEDVAEIQKRYLDLGIIVKVSVHEGVANFTYKIREVE